MREKRVAARRAERSSEAERPDDRAMSLDEQTQAALRAIKEMRERFERTGSLIG